MCCVSPAVPRPPRAREKVAPGCPARAPPRDFPPVQQRREAPPPIPQGECFHQAGLLRLKHIPKPPGGRGLQSSVRDQTAHLPVEQVTVTDLPDTLMAGAQN